MKYFDQLWYDCALDKIKQLKKDGEKFVVFDVGAGDSVLELPVRALQGEWIGFDYKPRKAGIIKLDLEQPLPPDLIDKKPDIILHLEVIEHVFNAGRAMANLSAMARPGTYMILTTPNPFWSLNRLKFLFLNQFPNFEPGDTEAHHHVFTVWPHVLKKLLANNEFTLLEEFTLGSAARFPSLKSVIRNPFRIPVYLLRKLLERINPESRGMSYGVVVIRR